MILEDHASELIHEAVLERVNRLIKNERLAHAYLFVGPAEIGKSETALAVAKLINCEDQSEENSEYFCNQCAACQKINHGNHPDIQLTESKIGEPIKIEQIREVLNQARLRPFFAKRKIYILQNIENCTLEAGNALLKTLEEPNSSSLLILTTSVPERIMGTIKSRCHQIPFLPSPQAELASRLKKYYDVDKTSSQFLSYFAEGCLGKALRLKDDNVYVIKNEYIDRFILSDDCDEVIKEVLSEKEKTKEFMDVLLSWIRDCLIVHQGLLDRQVIHADRINDLKKFQKRFKFEELTGLFKDIVEARKMLAENLNLKIPLLIIKERLNG